MKHESKMIEMERNLRRDLTVPIISARLVILISRVVTIDFKWSQDLQGKLTLPKLLGRMTILISRLMSVLTWGLVNL